jgi:hypothetical protein
MKPILITKKKPTLLIVLLHSLSVVPGKLFYSLATMNPISSLNILPLFHSRQGSIQCPHHS